MQAIAHVCRVNIAIVMDGFSIGGTELNATRTLEAFSRRGVHVNVLHFHQTGELHARIEAAGHHLVHVPIVPLWSPRIIARIAALAQALKCLNVSVVHTQDVYSNILGVAAARMLTRIPVLSSRRWKDEVPRRGMTALNAFAHRQSSLVLPNSPTLTATLLAEGVQRAKIAVHENFIDDKSLSLLPNDRKAAWRVAHGIPYDSLVIGCVARLTRVKRHDVLLESFAIAARQSSRVVLVLVGDGDMRPSLEQRADALGIRERVIFTGTLPNSPLPQQFFDVCVLTSENEGFPNSVVEASACGVPLVSTLVGGVTDILIEGETGIGVGVADVEGTANALLTLLNDAGLRQRMGDAGRALVTARFSESAAIDRLLGIYAKAAR
jgi:glycosyltransferase involved in cell wall biosynthesis